MLQSAWERPLVRTAFWAVLAIATAAAPAAVRAEVAGTAHQEEGITVKARQIEERLSAELKAYGHPVAVITAQEIEEAGYTEIYQMLETLVPGMFISMKAGPGDYANYSLNGSNELLWLVDGVRINNRLYSTGYLDTISPDMIERIEILYGGEGLFYGTEAASGVINIITKPVTKDLSMQFGAAYGQYERRNLYGYVSDTVDGNGFMVWGANDAWDGYQPFSDQVLARVGNSRKEKRSYDRTNLGMKYEREFNFAGRSQFRFQYQHNTNPAEFARPTEQFALNDREENLGILKWDHDLNESLSYYVKAYYHDWWTDYTRRKLDGAYLNDEDLWGYQDWGVNAMSSYRFGEGHEILAGMDYQNYYGSDEVLLIKGEHEEVWALFAQYHPALSFAPFLKPALGVRYNQTGGSDKLIWNASARAELPWGFYARGMVGTSFILPNAYQLYTDEETYVGNPDLKPEESTNIDLGVGIKRSMFFAEAGWWHQDIKDLISLTSTGGERDTFRNSEDDSEFQGYTLLAGVGPFLGFSLSASYSRIEATSGDSDQQMANVPEYMYKGQLGWRGDFGGSLLGATLAARYIGDLHNYDTGYGNYWLADLSAFWKFGDRHRHMFTVRAENLFDEKYYSRLDRANDTEGERFVYGMEGMPLCVMAGYTFYF